MQVDQRAGAQAIAVQIVGVEMYTRPRLQSVLMVVSLISTVLFGALMSTSADAQPAARVFRIGTLGNENTPTWEGFRQGLRDLGYVEGRNIVTEARWSEGSPDRLPALARELVALKPDVIVASSTQAIRAAKDAT